MKKLLCALLTALLLFSAAFAEEETCFIYDMTGVFSESEKAELEKEAAEAFEATGYRMYFVYLPVEEGETSIKNRVLAFSEEHAFPDNSIVFAETDKLLYVNAFSGFAGRMPGDFLDLVLNLDETSSSVRETVSRYLELCRSMLLGIADTPSAPEQSRRLSDEDDLLTDAEEQALRERLDRFSETRALELAVVLPKTLGGKTPQQFADDYYDYNGFGNGSGDDGALLLICMEDRDMAISTYGYGITVFSDYGIEQAMDAIRPYLSGGDFAGGIGKFIDRAEMYLDSAENGEIYDKGSDGSSPDLVFIAAIGILSVIIAFFITMGRARSSLKSVRRKAEAGNYLKEAPVYSVCEDIFLHTTVTKTRKVESSSSGGSKSGGGSSTHHSSSGRSHGGGHSKF